MCTVTSIVLLVTFMGHSMFFLCFFLNIGPPKESIFFRPPSMVYISVINTQKSWKLAFGNFWLLAIFLNFWSNVGFNAGLVAAAYFFDAGRVLMPAWWQRLIFWRRSGFNANFWLFLLAPKEQVTWCNFAPAFLARHTLLVLLGTLATLLTLGWFCNSLGDFGNWQI